MSIGMNSTWSPARDGAIGPWRWDPLLVSYTTHSRSSWLNKVLECLSKGIGEASTGRQYFAGMKCHYSWYSICIKSETSKWCYVPNTKSTWVQKPRGRSIYYVLWCTGSLMLPISAVLGSYSVRNPGPQRGSAENSESPWTTSSGCHQGTLDSSCLGTSWYKKKSPYCQG